MTDEAGDEAWRPPDDTAQDGAKQPIAPAAASPQSEWAPPAALSPPAPSPPGSTLAPPPAPPLAPTISTGPIEATSARPRWLGRVMALLTAGLLIGGGGFLAINAGASRGGADSPSGALQGMLDSLSAEDLIGAAEFIEPTERATIVDAGFEVIDQLVRLEVFAEDLDLGAVRGFDIDFDDLEIEVREIRPGMAQIRLEGGLVRTSIDGSVVPLGALITERIDPETLAVRESTSERIEPTDVPIVAVQRDGRWYLSLWYSVAENARLAADASLPDPSERPTAIGGDTPERAVDNFVAAASGLDLATMIGLLDPDEAAALYDYSPLFLRHAQDQADSFLAEIRTDGWRWEVTDLSLRSEVDGGLATVLIDGAAFEATGPEGMLEVRYARDRSHLSFIGDDLTLEVLVEGDCVIARVDEGRGPEVTEFCSSELAEQAGLEALTGGAFANLQSLSTPGVVVREVDGRWYISPLRTGSLALIEMLRSIEPEALAETVDAFTEFLRDPFPQGLFGFADPFATDSAGGFGETDLGETGTGTDLGFVETGPNLDEFTGEHLDLLSDRYHYLDAHDLTGEQREDVWTTWLTEAEPRGFDTGVIAQGYIDAENTYREVIGVVVLTGIPFDSDAALAEWVDGEIMADGDLTYVRATTNWSGPFAIVRSGDGVVLVGGWGGWSTSVLDVLRVQSGG